MRSKAFWQPSGRVPRLRIPRVANSVAAFSLLELLAVIAILGMLAGIGAPMVIRAQRQARQADCRSNLRQFGIALAAYRSDHNGRNPPWLSNLYPEYVDGKDIYVCKSDRDILAASRAGQDTLAGYHPVPDGLKLNQYPEVSDFGSGSADGRNSDIKLNSYFYEFSAAACSWDHDVTHDIDGEAPTPAWWEAKEWQLRYGDAANGGGRPDSPHPYSTARMPIVRCWHHWNEDRIPGYTEGESRDHPPQGSHFLVLNVGYAGNVFASPPWWEGRPDVGEK